MNKQELQLDTSFSLEDTDVLDVINSLKDNIDALNEENEVLKKQAQSVAEANVRAAELMIQLEDVNESLAEEILEHKKTQEQLKLINEEMETRVRERTSELALANEKLKREVESNERYQKKLELSVEHAELMRKEAVSSNLAKSEFLANMSHEIRTPMNAIVGFSEIMLEEDSIADQRHVASMINGAANNLLQIINDILDFSEIEAGKVNTEKIAFNLGEEIFPDVMKSMHINAKAKDLDLKLTITNNIPKLIKSDPIRIKQCLINLLNNAIKFTDQGYVELAVSKEICCNEEFIKFEINDTGIGIEEKDLRSIFEVFTQGDSSSSKKYAGTGLGLPITKKLVEVLGGEICVKSKLGEGSSFRFMIPTGFKCVSADDGLKTKKSGVNNNRPEENKNYQGNVLVAEDNPSNQMLIKMLLGKYGIDPVIAVNGKEAVEKVSSEQYDLIFMDIQMPVMNGYEAVRHLRDKDCNIPIVALTANAMKEDREKCISAGCDDYISKPIDRNKLVSVLDKYVAVKQ